jgi:hypothetical protein
MISYHQIGPKVPAEIQSYIIQLRGIDNNTLPDIYLVSKLWAYELRKIQYRHCNLVDLPSAICFFNAILHPLPLLSDASLMPGNFVRSIQIGFSCDHEEDTQQFWDLLEQALPLLKRMQTFIMCYTHYGSEAFESLSELAEYFPPSLELVYFKPIVEEIFYVCSTTNTYLVLPLLTQAQD